MSKPRSSGPRCYELIIRGLEQGFAFGEMGSGTTAKQQSGARECPLWVCERGGVTGDALDFALETTRSKKSDVRDQLMSLFVTLDPCAVTPVGVSSHLVGKFRNLDQCKAAAA